MRWLSCAERYFRYYRTPEASIVDVTAIHLERDVRQWPSEYENIDGQLAKIRQTSIIQEYQTRFERLSNQARDWSEKQLLGTFIEGLKPEIREVKVRQPYTLTVAISFALIQEKRLNQDVRRTRTMPRPAAYKPSTTSASSRPSQLKKLIREELRDRSTKGLCWHCDEPWSHDHRCKRGRLLLIESINDSEHEEEDLEHEEVTGEEP
ncbi:hypothetical protein BHE74_00030270 [Ensete ventricosum]|nr:hypothetical protein BHE74_00030270 [Ensete ventricosum]